MADQKITDLTALTSVDPADLLAIVDDVAGTPTTKKVTVANLLAAGGGAVVQVKNVQTGATATGTTIMPLDDTIPQNTEGTEFMTLAITPTSATNKLRIDVVIFMTPDASNWMSVALFQDSTASALAAWTTYQNTSTAGAESQFTHYMTAGTTSATTFKVRAGRDASAGTTYTFNGGAGVGRLFGGVMASSITITEIVP